MNISAILAKKRDGGELSDDEIEYLIRGFCSDSVADYQMSALAMAVCINGMTPRETATLTRAMLESGDRLSRDGSDNRKRPRVDKHSTGGLGDKVSLVLAPLLAACDVEVPMISGRGLGITGGTLDKLESIRGFQTDLTPDQSERTLKDVGAFIISASESIAPADRRLYALRDVTATVTSKALITASILSKKLAANLDALAMDVKVGAGAFMNDINEATELAETLVKVGSNEGLPTSVLITDMDQPLGNAIGNAIEVNEAVDVLSGEGPSEVRELTIELAANLLHRINGDGDRQSLIQRLERTIDDGRARERFEKMVRSQGGVWKSTIPLAEKSVIDAPSDGYIKKFDSQLIGETIIAMGGGRRRKGDRIDHSVGIEIHGRIGKKVDVGEPILTLYCHETAKTDYLKVLAEAVLISPDPVSSVPLIHRRII